MLTTKEVSIYGSIAYIIMGACMGGRDKLRTRCIPVKSGGVKSGGGVSTDSRNCLLVNACAALSGS